MPSVNISSVAQKSKSQAVAKADTSAIEARQVLRDMRAQLVGRDGNVASGYLSINTRKDGTVNLETRGRHEWGSFHSDKKDATEIVKNLVREGFGSQLTQNSYQHLETALNKYLQTTGNRIGTQSFVKLIDHLEKNIGAAEAGSQTAAKVKGDVRFKAEFNIKLKTEGASIHARTQFAEVNKLVKFETAKLFEHLLSPGVSKSAKVAVANPTQVVGDADGSICRTMLAAINSGHMKLESSELKLLAEVMDAEAKASAAYDQRNDHVLKEFQKNPEIAQKLDQIVKKATFQAGKHKLLFIGDIVHDRFSNNKQAMDKLIRGLHANGAVFITGNHDVYDEVNPQDDLQLDSNDIIENYINQAQNDNPTIDLKTAKERGNESFQKNFEPFKIQNGFYGVKQLTKAQSDKLIKDCFKNAHFDSVSNTLYTHNGFQHSGVEDVYLTANGFLRAQNAEELAAKMNACDFNDSSRGFQTISLEGLPNFKEDFLKDDNLRKIGIQLKADEEKMMTLYNVGINNNGTISKTAFRPHDDQMQTPNLKNAAMNKDGQPITIVHGHEFKISESGNVLNLNARNDQGVKPVTKML